ncbi:MAG: hypothetical protein ACR2FY_11225 [Pirellulaceae bacterium]
MSFEQRHFSPIFSIDVSADTAAEQQSSQIDANELLVMLLKQLLEGQKKEIALLTEITHHIAGPHKSRHQELMKWKEAHPELADSCRGATELLGKVQEQFLCNLTTEIADSDETLVDSDFMLNEFIDRFGPRLHHLNGLLQVLSQLGSVASPPANATE